MFVKPAAGRKVRDPKTMQYISDDGAEVPESTFWLRRLRDGDVVTAEIAPVADPVVQTDQINDYSQSKSEA